MAWQKFCKRENWHKDAELLPLMNDAALAALADDIEEHGVQQPIVLFQGKVLDGRNRLRACERLGVPLTSKNFVQFQTNGFSSRQFVFTQNLHRRHLSIDQRAAIAADLKPSFEAEMEKRQIEAGKHGVEGGRGNKKPSSQEKRKGLTATKLAARFVGGVSESYVKLVLTLEGRNRGMLRRIKDGEITIADAKREDADKHFEPRPLPEQYVLKPLTFLDAREEYWRKRKGEWKAHGVMGGHVGQKRSTYNPSLGNHTSEFDAVLAEFVYASFCPPNGRVLDPFSGEAIKGLVAARKGLHYVGIDCRRDQVAVNGLKAKELGLEAKWVYGNSEKLSSLKEVQQDFDLIFTSPPYADLEEYSDDNPDDISGAPTYPEFLERYKTIFQNAEARLKSNRFLVVKIGDTRDNKGFLRNLVSDSISCFLELGLKFYNHAILVTSDGSAPRRVANQFRNYRKLVGDHQHVLCFFKGDNPKVIPEEFGLISRKLVRLDETDRCNA